MGNVFSHPATIIVVIILIILLFGAPKLPGMARSLGQSMRIFKSEVEGMKNDAKKDKEENEQKTETVTAEVVDNGKSEK
ncbi:MAG: Sec-independent protein translocase subunit TatA [Rothia sp. (in: high G+C Gram-positive bacteria)]|uniref:Sec-independent protein translocase subunit TatA n=1 Tax=Rothia sp. (in: high G+C Gram-positive bacteria) TaxID=1885016 RepID=UPI0026DEC87A|nr:Sec-independent protein translocase subunit TatA [Rothia sp. (in: high G+C Gram-positive bacteria)]MDO5750667.1 Sec-independent protein translocase subunit TatA [Rothia sp. (in: high G+C Gram-positive bacteria)]